MKSSLYLFSILLLLGFFAVHFTVYMAHADDATTVKGSKSNSDNRQIQTNPEPVEATTVKSSKSNSSERQVQPVPEPVEGTTVKSSKDRGGDGKRGTASQKPGKCGNIRDDSGDTSRGAKGDSSTCGGVCEVLGDICTQHMLNGPCFCESGI